MSTVLEENPVIEEQTKNYDMWKVVVLNDNYHTFEYVLWMLVECLAISLEESMRMTKNIHETGREIVYGGMREPAEHFYEKISNYPLEVKFGRQLPKIGVRLEQ